MLNLYYKISLTLRLWQFGVNSDNEKNPSVPLATAWEVANQIWGK